MAQALPWGKPRGMSETAPSVEKLASPGAISVAFPSIVEDSTVLRTLTNTTILGRGMP